MSFQKHEGKIAEEGTRLDPGEEGEEEETGTVCAWVYFQL